MTCGSSSTPAPVTRCSWTTGTVKAAARPMPRRCCLIARGSSYWWTAEWLRENHPLWSMLQHVKRRKMLPPTPRARSKDRDHSSRDRNSWRGSRGAPVWWLQESRRILAKQAPISSKTSRTYFRLIDDLPSRYSAWVLVYFRLGS